MTRVISKLKKTEDDVTQWQTQVGNNTTNQKVKIYSTLPEFSATIIAT